MDSDKDIGSSENPSKHSDANGDSAPSEEELGELVGGDKEVRAVEGSRAAEPRPMELERPRMFYEDPPPRGESAREEEELGKLVGVDGEARAVGGTRAAGPRSEEIERSSMAYGDPPPREDNAEEEEERTEEETANGPGEPSFPPVRALTRSQKRNISAAKTRKKRKELGIRKIKRKFTRPFAVLPLEIVVKILCQVSVKDLINLVKTSKVFARLLLSSQYRTIWSSQRIQRKITKFADVGEVWFAVRMCGRTCEICGRTHKMYRMNWVFRLIVCKRCFNEEFVSSRKMLHRMDPTLHPASTRCVPYLTTVTKPYAVNFPEHYKMFRFSDLQNVSLDLWRFDDYDDEEHSAEALNAFIRKRQEYFANSLVEAQIVRFTIRAANILTSEEEKNRVALAKRGYS